MSGHFCLHEEDWGTVKEYMKHTTEFIQDIKDNHLPHIYEKLDSRPSWLIASILAFASMIIATLVTVVLK